MSRSNQLGETYTMTMSDAAFSFHAFSLSLLLPLYAKIYRNKHANAHGGSRMDADFSAGGEQEDLYLYDRLLIITVCCISLLPFINFM